MSAEALDRMLRERGVRLEAKLRYQASEPLDDDVVQLIAAHKGELIRHLALADAVPPLPWQLDRLVRAASSGVLDVTLDGVPDPPRHVMGWACAYLLGEREHALERLWQAYQAWEAKAEAN